MATDPVELDLFERIAIVRLNRPDVHNAVDDKVMRALERIQRQLDRTPLVSVVILTGSGFRTFCAGGDLDYFRTLKSKAQGRAMSRRMQKILDGFWRGSRVVVGAINGNAIGGGCEIVTACHLRIAANTAQFHFRHVLNGLTTGWGGGRRLLSQIRRPDALALLLAAQPITAREAHRIGLINRRVPAGSVAAECLKLARTIAATSSGAREAFLRLHRAFDDRHARAHAGLETDLFAERWTSSDFRTQLVNRR